MDAIQTKTESNGISSERFISVIGEIFGEQNYPNPEDPQPPGPWDPYIHKALRGLREKLERQKFFPHEEAWRQVLRLAGLNGKEEIWDVISPRAFAGLNPQPLPPRAVVLAAIAGEVAERALLIQETADAINETSDQRGIIVIGGRLVRFVNEIDELCPRIPRPIPPPRGGLEDRFSGLELTAAGAVFAQTAKTIANDELRLEFETAAANLIEQGLART